MSPTRSTAPVLVFGFDAGHPDDLVRWAKEGHLPALATVLERGGWARTAGPELLSEHGVWVPLLNGISRGDLGYYYFRQLEPRTYNLQPITGLDLTYTPLWARLADRRRFAIIDVPETLPRPGLGGVQLANWAGHIGWKSDHPAYQVSAHPPEVLADLTERFGPSEVILESVDSTLDQDREIFRRLLRRVERKGAVTRHLLGGDGFDFSAVVFTEPHTAGHQFWKYRPEAPETARKQAATDLRHAIRDVCRAVDRELSLLLAQMPADTTVFIMSSVGIEDYYPTQGLTEAFCRQLGYQAAPLPAPMSWQPLDLARRLLPTSVRVALSRLLLSRDRREGLLAEGFRRATDWTRTTAFAVPAFYAGQIRVNLRGREPDGIVSPGLEYEMLLDRLEGDLRQLTLPDSGAPAVRTIHRPGTLFGRNPPEIFPDLWVEWAPSREFVEMVRHPRAELRQIPMEFMRDSDHCRTGFIAAAGPGIGARGAQPDVSVLDVAPTLLRLLGAAVPAELTGRPLTAWLATCGAGIGHSVTKAAAGRHTLDGTIRVFLSEALVLPTGLITLSFLTRQLGATDYGLFTLTATAVAWIEWSLAAMFSRATNKWISNAEDWEPVATTALRLYLVVSVVVALLLVLAARPAARALGEPELTRYLRLFAIDIPLFCLAIGYRNILVGIGRYRQRAWLSAGRWIVRLVLVLLLVGLGLSVNGAIAAMIGASVAELLIARRFIRPALWRPSGFPARKLLASAVPLLLLGVSLRLFDNLDLYILKVLGASAAQAGLYGLAENLSVVPSLFAQAFAPLLMSTLMRLRRDGQEAHARAMARDSLRLVILLVPLAAIVAGAAPEIVRLVAGAQFGEAGPLLRLLIFAALALVLVSVSTAILITVDRSAAALLLAGPMVVLAVFGHLWAIPRWGSVGAAAVTTGAAGLGALAAVVGVAMFWRVVPPFGSVARSLAAGALLYLVAMAWSTPGWFVVVKMSALALVALSLYLVTGEFDARERALAWSLVPWISTSRS